VGSGSVGGVREQGRLRGRRDCGCRMFRAVRDAHAAEVLCRQWGHQVHAIHADASRAGSPPPPSLPNTRRADHRPGADPVVACVRGCCCCYCCLGCPPAAEIVPAKLRSLVYAFDRSFEGAVASMVAPLVGVLAEREFGFTPGGVADKAGECAGVGAVC
jgi:hypothetical protein